MQNQIWSTYCKCPNSGLGQDWAVPYMESATSDLCVHFYNLVYTSLQGNKNV
jgi:hypothetical protein